MTPRSFLDALYDKRFVYLFICLLLPYIFHPLIETEVVGITILDMAFTLVLLVAMFVMSDHHRLGVPVIVMVTLVIAVTWIANSTLYKPIHLLALALNAAFMLYTTIYLLNHILHRQSVTINTIFASLCVYLLLGFVWSFIYSILEVYSPGSFYIDDKVFRFEIGKGHVFSQLYYFMYYSFTTITSLGMGDIMPATPTARVITVLEAILGQIYLIVLVSRLVGMHISQATSTITHVVKEESHE